MDITGKYFLYFERGGKRRSMKRIVLGTANLYPGRVISFLIKFLDMQSAFSDVLGFSSAFFSCRVANHEQLISGTITGGAFWVPTHAKAAF